MTFKELVAKADQEITYPFEGLLEAHLPRVDHIIDILLYLVLASETFVGPGQGDKKKALVMTWVVGILSALPLAAPLRAGIIALFSVLIDKLIDFLNDHFPNGFLEAAQGVTKP